MTGTNYVIVVFDLAISERVKIAVAGVAGLLRLKQTLFREREAWELIGSVDLLDYAEAALIALNVEYFRIA